ncbi:MAG: RagB/SusD family nutrient uptake outer membrane protein [Prevotella sp.]|nr:RagB/SusD family nutrient uptake outer membrane protein [Prevotella sp.]
MITKINNTVKWMVCAALLTVQCSLFTSCNDFLDILPMNDVVLENYWTEKADVISVRNSCYESLTTSDAMSRIGIWGELRSDNLFAGANIPNEVSEVLKENLLSTNPYCNWAKIYECINRCNIVSHYAPKVQAIDPNYSEAEMKADVAEVSALRALCYFYLIRTFRDVPYSREPSIDDTQTYIIPATKFDNVLDSLITDLERVKDDAVRRFELDRVNGSYYSFPAVNSSRFTRVAIWALLADLYLWKQDWDNAIKYADMVIDFKRQQYDELLSRVGDINEIGLIDEVPLYLECPTGSGDTGGNAYEAIFGEGNSFESLFELYFLSSNDSQVNSWVSDYYGNRNTPNGRLRANALSFGTELLDVIQNKIPLYKSTDGRFYECFRVDGKTLNIGKYVNGNVSYNTKSVTSVASLRLNTSYRGDNKAPWIFYRLTDMLLIKAEALVERGQEGDMDAAFDMVNIVNKRANNLTQALKKDEYINSKNAMENLVFDERRREFMFEGKRWFDLVRRSRRDGNTAYLVAAVKSKYEQNANAIAIKMADPNIIYFPYAKNELKVNPLLQQNPAFTNGEDSEYSR